MQNSATVYADGTGIVELDGLRLDNLSPATQRAYLAAASAVAAGL